QFRHKRRVEARKVQANSEAGAGVHFSRAWFFRHELRPFRLGNETLSMPFSEALLRPLPGATSAERAVPQSPGSRTNRFVACLLNHTLPCQRSVDGCLA